MEYMKPLAGELHMLLPMCVCASKWASLKRKLFPMAALQYK